MQHLHAVLGLLGRKEGMSGEQVPDSVDCERNQQGANQVANGDQGLRLGD